MIGWRRSIGVRIQGQKPLVLLRRIARRMVVLSLLCAHLLLRMSSQARECCCGQRYRTQSKKAAPCGVFQLECLVCVIAHHRTFGSIGWIGRSIAATIRHLRVVVIILSATFVPNCMNRRWHIKSYGMIANSRVLLVTSLFAPAYQKTRLALTRSQST